MLNSHKRTVQIQHNANVHLHIPTKQPQNLRNHKITLRAQSISLYQGAYGTARIHSTNHHCARSYRCTHTLQKTKMFDFLLEFCIAKSKMLMSNEFIKLNSVCYGRTYISTFHTFDLADKLALYSPKNIHLPAKFVKPFVSTESRNEYVVHLSSFD